MQASTIGSGLYSESLLPLRKDLIRYSLRALLIVNRSDGVFCNLTELLLGLTSFQAGGFPRIPSKAELDFPWAPDLPPKLIIAFSRRLGYIDEANNEILAQSIAELEQENEFINIVKNAKDLDFILNETVAMFDKSLREDK
ncbi:MAG TPA: hypothetical protein PL072_09390 [Phycisphaerales bacterium]|nr:hypothetical protein [Phycisphaerales bacterium]